MRTFIAVEVPAAIKDEIAQLVSRLKGTGTDVKWVEPGNIHVTLKFLGNIETDQPAVIRDGLHAALDSTGPFDLTLGRVGAFPDLNRPRVFWVSVGEGRDELIAMQQRIESELHARGFVREERPFSPHLTIGRVRSPRGLAKLTELVRSTAFENRTVYGDPRGGGEERPETGRTGLHGHRSSRTGMTMPTITDITPRGSGGRRERKVTIDGRRTLTITEETFIRFGIFDGQAMDPERLREMERADGVARAMMEAHRLIDHRMRTRRELVVRLRSRGRPDDVIEEVMDRLENVGLIDDGRFARQWIDERLRSRPVGLSLLRSELRKKGIDAEVIETALEDSASGEGETERAYEALRRQTHRYARLDRDAAHRRMVAFLGRRGFGQDVIYHVVHRLLDEIEESRN